MIGRMSVLGFLREEEWSYGNANSQGSDASGEPVKNEKPCTLARTHTHTDTHPAFPESRSIDPEQEQSD